MVTYITNISNFSSKASAINSVLLMSSNFLIIDKVSAVIWLFYSNCFPINCILVFEKLRKNISKTVFLLVLTNKKVLSKNQIFSSLSLIEKSANTIL